ncbi:MAG: DUF6623 family protein [Pseudomonadota bacterium]
MLSKRQALRRFVFGLGGLGLAAQGSAASLAALPDPLAVSWVHGHGTDIGFPDLIESATSSGGSKVLRGRSFSDNRLHFALNVPPGKARVQAILLRFRTLPGAELRFLRVYDSEREVAVLADLHLQQGDWGEQRIALPELPRITRGLGVTLGIGFGGVDREFAISALGAEFIA